MICIEIELLNFLSHNKDKNFIGILAKMQDLEDIESIEAKPSGDLTISEGKLFGCIENKACDLLKTDSHVDTIQPDIDCLYPIFVSVTNRILLRIHRYVITKSPFSFQTKAKINHLSVIELVKTL